MGRSGNNPYRNLSLYDARQLAARFGAEVQIKEGTGELHFSHPLMERPVNVHCTKPRAGRHLTCWLRSIEGKLNYLLEVLDRIPGPGGKNAKEARSAS